MKKIIIIISLIILSTSINANDNSDYDNAINNFLSEINNKSNIKSQNIDELYYNKENEINKNTQADTNNFFNTANILILNKITAKTTKIFIKNKQTIFEKLTIKIFGCWSEDNNHKALLKINYNNKINLFSGWMFSKFYFLNTINSNIYDIRLISCQNTDKKILY